MIESITIGRQTKYCDSIKVALAKLGHASNAELLNFMQTTFPNLSATTVHRATARLASRNEIAIAPQKQDGSIRYDNNLKSHDHFQCSNCGLLRDADIKDKITPILKSSINDCDISGRLTINGICKKCIQNKEKK